MALLAIALTVWIALSADQAFANHVSCGDTITQDTTLDSDLIDCPGDGVIVGANSITLDLNGHTVDGTLSGFSPISVGISNDAGHDRVRVVDGFVQEFFSGVRVEGASDNAVRGLSVSDTVGGIELVGSTGAEVVSNELARNLTHPILLFDTDRSLVADNLASNGVEGEGIVLSDSRENRVSRNVVRDGITGVLLDVSSDNLVDRNRVRGATGFGGVVLLDGNSHNDVVHNRISASIRGVDVEEANHENLVRANYAVDNSGDGIRIAVGGGSANVIARNLARGNGDDGIGIEEAGNTVASDLAAENGDFGIEAVTGTIDGGGNRAFGNGNPLQCLNVECR